MFKHPSTMSREGCFEMFWDFSQKSWTGGFWTSLKTVGLFVIREAVVAKSPNIRYACYVHSSSQLRHEWWCQYWSSPRSRSFLVDSKSQAGSVHLRLDSAVLRHRVFGWILHTSCELGGRSQSLWKTSNHCKYRRLLTSEQHAGEKMRKSFSSSRVAKFISRRKAELYRCRKLSR